MAEIIRVPNFSEINLEEQTILDADAASGQNQITVLNTAIYNASDFILVGQIGSEIGEVQKIQSIASSVVTLTANLAQKHNRGETIYGLFGDKVRLYRAPNVDGTAPADNAFSLVTSDTIQGDDVATDIIDPSGGSSYWYKTTYYNSVTADETSLALSIAVRGGDYGHLVSVDAIRLEAGLLDNQLIDSSRFAERRDHAESEILSALAAAGYTIPLQNAAGVPYTPPVVENIARILSAGYVLLQEYGAVAEGDNKNGELKVKQARKMLESIQKQEQVLLDMSGTPIVRNSQVSGWPDNTTQYVGTDGSPEPFQMTMSKVF